MRFFLDEKIVKILAATDRVQWKESAKTLRAKIHVELTTISTEKQIDQSDNLDHIYEYCQQIKWNVANEDLTALVLTIRSESNEHICSLSNAELPVAYNHLCQYGKSNKVVLLMI